MSNDPQMPASEQGHSRVITTVALGFWSVAITLGALRVILPVYFASLGVSVTKIALFFVAYKASEVIANGVTGLAVNRLGYRRSYVGGLLAHTILSLSYILTPPLWAIYFIRLGRGMIGMNLLTSVYVRHFSPRESRRFHINLILGVKEAGKGVGMAIGGVLLALLSFKLSLVALGLFTAVETLLAFRYLPEVRERERVAVRRLWQTVPWEVKVLATARGFVYSARDCWAAAIAPVVLVRVFDLSASAVGFFMMVGLLALGGSQTLFARYLGRGWSSRTSLVVCGLAIAPVPLLMGHAPALGVFAVGYLLYYVMDGLWTSYHNHFMIEQASLEKTSIDLGAYKVIANVVPPFAVMVSGMAADAYGLAAAFYVAAGFALLGAVTPLALGWRQSEGAATQGIRAEPAVEPAHVGTPRP
ncbi:MAG: MFS transporter [Deltaproteobacteria bacterium]|nr:MFS transporter [Deltaproteobacteria bacterium]